MQTLGPPHVFLQLIFKFCVKVYDPLAVLFSNSNEIGEVGPSFVLERCQDFFILDFIKIFFEKLQLGSYAAIRLRVHQKDKQIQVFHISENYLWVILQEFTDHLPEMGNLIQVGYFVKPLYHPAVDFFSRFFSCIS